MKVTRAAIERHNLEKSDAWVGGKKGFYTETGFVPLEKFEAEFGSAAGNTTYEVEGTVPGYGFYYYELIGKKTVSCFPIISKEEFEANNKARNEKDAFLAKLKVCLAENLELSVSTNTVGDYLKITVSASLDGDFIAEHSDYTSLGSLQSEDRY